MTVKVSNVSIGSNGFMYSNTTVDTVTFGYQTGAFNIGKTSITVNTATVNSSGLFSGSTKAVHGPTNSHIIANINSPGVPGTLQSNVVYSKASYPTPYTTAIYYTDDSLKNSGNWSTSLNSFLAGVTGVAYGNGLFVAVMQASGGWMANFTSNLYTTWTQSTTLGNTNAMNCLDYQPANNLFIASGVGGAIQTTSDGITWTNRTTANTNQMQGIGIVSGATLLVGNGGALQSSTTSTTWTNRTTANTNTMWDAAYSPGLNLWVVVGDGGAIQTSTGAFVTWTNRTSANTIGPLYRVVFAANLFVAVGSSIQTSTNGTTWINRTKNSTNDLRSLVYANGFFLAGSTTGELEVSTDGIRWVPGSYSYLNGSSNIARDMTVGNGVVVIVGDSFTRSNYTNVFTYDITTQFKVAPIPGIATNETSYWVYQ